MVLDFANNHINDVVVIAADDAAGQIYYGGALANFSLKQS